MTAKNRPAENKKTNPKMIISLLSLLPLFYLIRYVVQYKVNVPFGDQWELIPLLDKSYSGTLTFHDLWVQHNEHRILFPKLIMISLARLTGWNINYELGISILIAAATFLVLTAQLLKTSRETKKPVLIWLIPFISVIVFSLEHYENWLWGWQIQIFLSMLGALSALFLLSDRSFKWGRLAAAAAMAVLSTFSFGSGLICWPVGALVLAVVPYREKKQRLLSLAVWSIVGLIIIAAFAHGYETPSYHPSRLIGLQHPDQLILYISKFMGVLFSFYSPFWAAFAGLAGIAAVTAATWILVKRRGVDFGVLLPYAAVSIFSLGSALLTGIARVGFGSDQALSPRYTTVAYPFWIYLIVLLALLAVTGRKTPEEQPTGSKNTVSVLPTIGVVLLFAILLSRSIISVRNFVAFNLITTEIHNYFLFADSYPDVPPNIEIINEAHTRNELVAERIGILKKHDLTFFSHPTINDTMLDLRRYYPKDQ